MAQSVPTLQKAAFNALKLPARVNTMLQDEIPGAESRTKGGNDPSGRSRKNTKGEKEASPTKDDDKIPTRAKKVRRGMNQSLDELLERSTETPASNPSSTPSSAEFAAQLAAQIGKVPSPEEMNDLRKQLSDVTLRADREQQRADAEKLRADAEKEVAAGLREELVNLRKQLDANAVAAAAAAGNASTSARAEETETAEVRQLKNEIQWLRSQNETLIGLLSNKSR